MAKISNKELLKIAQDEETTSEQLRKIWVETKSIKVRKAVASNPNADAVTLRYAARLYIEEVLENPGFDVLRLFDDDEWVRKIGEVYDNPDTWSTVYYYARRTEQLEPFARAALLSKSLNKIQLNSIIEFLPTTSIKRSCKYEKTRIRVRDLLIKGGNEFSLEALFKAYSSEVITELELYECLRYISYVGSLSCRKSVYTRAIKLMLKALEEKKPGANKALAMILVASRSSCLRWIEYTFEHKHLEVLASALLTAKRVSKKFSSTSKTTIQLIGSIITGILWEKFNFEERKANLEYIYKSMCKLSLDTHPWGDTKFTWGPIQITNEMCDELLKQDIRVKAFFVRNKCLGTWFSVQKSSSKFQILEEVNNWMFKRGGFDNLLYNSVSLKKIVTISDDVIIAH